jgi:integrase/recombinase XerC
LKIEEFVQSLEVRSPSRHTLRAYRQDLQRFSAYLVQRSLSEREVTPQVIQDYMKHLADNKGRTAGITLAPATTSRYLTVISAYYQWLSDSLEEPIRNPVARVKRPKIHNRLLRAVDDSTITTLIEGIPVIRDKALLLLFVYSGLRLAELQQLNKDSISLRRRKLPDGSFEQYGLGQVVGKGGKQRLFMLGPNAVRALAQYIATDRASDSVSALFLSSRRHRLSCRTIQQILSKWCVRLKIKHIYVHQLRHTFATRNVNAGMSAIVLQQLMGHANLNTTNRYFTIREERLTREYHAAMEFIRETSAA